MFLFLTSNVFIGNQVHTITCRRYHTYIGHGVKGHQFIKRDGFMKEINGHKFNGTVFTINTTYQFINNGLKMLVFLNILTGRNGHLNQHYLTNPFRMIRKKLFQGMKFLGHPFNVIQTTVVVQRGKRVKDDDGWIAMVDQINSSWKDTIRPLFQHYTERTPGSFIEEKEVNITWHYRNADPEFGSWQAAELQCNLEKILSHMALTIVLGKKTLELRPASVDKSTIAKCILKDLKVGQPSVGDIDFILCIGDGKTDEPVFTMLNAYNSKDFYTATVGKKLTEAKFYINSVPEVQHLLHDLISTTTSSPTSTNASTTAATK